MTPPLQFIYDQTACAGTEHCAWNTTRYMCQVVVPTGITVPPLTGGDSHDPAQCPDATFTAIENSLQLAVDMCHIVHRRGRRTVNDEQVECLEFFLSEAGSQWTLSAVCPCLWKFAIEVSPVQGSWLKLDC